MSILGKGHSSCWRLFLLVRASRSFSAYSNRREPASLFNIDSIVMERKAFRTETPVRVNIADKTILHTRRESGRHTNPAIVTALLRRT
ncbi:hypothetical protein F4779DRAFT_516637 [Xylariaceae sp. FL0662B]|nr:hypothetical protein F4779DRAFT_516637 [Xylariaceae sp. FL0662B]